MFRKLMIAGVVATFATPALADWNVIQLSGTPSASSASGTDVCVVVDRAAAAGEQLIAGPFPTQAAGLAAEEGQSACTDGKHG